jgi:hypothetical protein
MGGGAIEAATHAKGGTMTIKGRRAGATARYWT